MGTFVQENKRAVVMLAVVVGVALVAVAFMMLTGRSGEPEAGPVPKATPTVSPEPEPEETQAQGSFAPTTARSNSNPFAPLAGSDADSDTQTTKAKYTKRNNDAPKSANSSGGDSSKGSFADPGTDDEPTDVIPEPDSPDPADNDPQPVEPQPVEDPVAADGKLTVKVLSVTADTVEARVNGTAETLYLSVPDALGVTYVSNLGGGCAWLAGSADGARVTICQGQTETL